MAQPVSPSKFAHVVFRTSRYEEMKHWYCTVLNAHPVFENPMIAFLTFDEEHHRIALINIPGLQERSQHSVGVDHVAYTMPGLKALVDTYQRLREEGIKPVWCVNHGPTTSMYYSDPDGNRVEFQVDNYPTVEELQGWFKSGEFARNPIGINFDPERLVANYRDGVAPEEVVKHAYV